MYSYYLHVHMYVLSVISLFICPACSIQYVRTYVHNSHVTEHFALFTVATYQDTPLYMFMFSLLFCHFTYTACDHVYYCLPTL